MAKRKKKTAKKKRGRPAGVAGLSVAQLERIIARRKAAEAKTLKVKRNKIAKQLAALDKEIAALTGAAPTPGPGRRGPGRPRKKVTRKKRGRRGPGRPKRKVAKKAAKKAVRKKAGRVRSTPAQIARVQAAILKAIKARKGGLLKAEIVKAVKARPQTLNTALKKLLAAKKVKTKGITRNMRYMAA